MDGRDAEQEIVRTVFRGSIWLEGLFFLVGFLHLMLFSIYFH